MRALSIRQPWAWLITHGYKDIENRSWPTKFRGRFFVHAAKKFDEEGYHYVTETMPDIPLPDINMFDRGGIVGVAEIIDCVSEHPSRWFFGDYGFVIDKSEPLKFYPCPGALGFFIPGGV